jgi:magnesium transporter
MTINLASIVSVAIPRFRRRSRPGSRPGTVVARPDAPPSEIRVIRYGPDKIDDRRVVDVEELPKLIGDFPVTWVNVNGLGDDTVIKRIGELFQIHRLALEDVVNVHQRAKVESYENHIFVVARMVYMKDASSNPENTAAPNYMQLGTEQLSMFLGEGFVLTWQERPGDCFDPIRDRLHVSGRPIRKSGPDYLAYALLDAVIDAYFPVLDAYGQRLDNLDDAVGKDVSPEIMAEIHDVNGDLRGLRRIAWPHRDALRELRDEHGDLVADQTRVYLRDACDHMIHVLDILESYRETCTDLRDYYLSAVSNRMNEIMKVLTITATIFIPLSFIAGIYGMNFDWQVSPYNMPELRWAFGYPLALAFMGATAAGMLLFFWRKGWIGFSSAPAKPGTQDE